jgi:Fungal specific transcription factor domain
LGKASILSPTFSKLIDCLIQVDATDPHLHFATVVPQRAMKNSILLYAIFAHSAQLLSRTSNYDESEAVRYYSQSVSLLVPTLSELEDNGDENLLAAIVLLRLYEERESKFHGLDHNDFKS